MIKKIGVFVPLAYPFGMIPQEFFLSYFKANEYLMSRIDELGEEVSIHLSSPHTFPIDANRNQCAALAINMGFDTTIWLDADQELQEDTLFRLLKNGADYPIYAGVYYLKKEPHHPIVFRAKEGFETFYPIWRMPEKELYYADMIGMGCVKIDTDVFKAIEKPWFKYGAIPAELKDIDETMKFKYDNLINDVSEDVYFWRQVRNTKYRIVVDPQIQVGHIRKDVVKPEWVMSKALLNKKIQQKQVEKEGKNFAEEWEKDVPKPELVHPNGKEVEYLL